MNFLKRLEELLQGKKSYVIAIVGAVLVGLQLYGIAIPEIVWKILGVLGLGALRSALGKVEPPK